MPTATQVVRGVARALLLALPMGCAARGSGTAASEVRELESFTEIDVGGAFELVIHVEDGAAQRVEISADDNLLGMIRTRVADGELDIDTSESMIRPKLAMKVEIWMPLLTELSISGAAELELSGVHGERFELELSGASESTISGKVDRFEVDASGASDLGARGLEAKIVDIEISGAGDAEVFASERLDAEISGAGSIRYWGKPAEVHDQVSGAGSISPGE